MTGFKERPYQKEAADSAVDYVINREVNPVVVLPTGTGKTIVLAGIIDRLLTHNPLASVLVLSHVREIVSQDYKALIKQFMAGVGIYSSAFGSREIKKITVGSIQTVFRTPEDFEEYDYVIVDEAHTINPKRSGMYRKLLEHIGNPPVVGLTATPFRLGTGYIHEGEKSIFDEVCCDYSSGEKFQSLIDDGYLCPVIGKGTLLRMNVDGVKMTGGDFNQKQLSKKVDRDEITDEAVKETINFGKNYRHWLVFAIDIKHAEHIAEKFNSMGVPAGVVHSKMDGQRSEEIEKFRSGEYRALINVNVLTTGFDFPNIDLIAMMRPTSSPVIHVQTIGRGTRPVFTPGFNTDSRHGRLTSIKMSGKTHCLVLDFGGNIKRLGPIDDIVIKKKKKKKGPGGPCVKECDKCMALNHIRLRECKVCGHKFDIKEKLLTSADTSTVTRGESVKKKETKSWLKVDGVSYSLHKKHGSPDSVKVDYHCGISTISQWVCIEHNGFAKRKALRWLERRLPGESPTTAQEILSARQRIRVPNEIFIEKNGKYTDVLDAKF